MNTATEQPALAGQIELTVMQHTPGPWVTYGHRNLFVMSESTAIEIGSVKSLHSNENCINRERDIYGKFK